MRIECAECGSNMQGRPKNVAKLWNEEVRKNEKEKEGDCAQNV